MGNDVIVTSFLRIVLHYFVCEYLLLIPIDVPSFKLVEGQIKELQGVVSNTSLPRLRMTKKPWQDKVKKNIYNVKTILFDKLFYHVVDNDGNLLRSLL